MAFLQLFANSAAVLLCIALLTSVIKNRKRRGLLYPPGPRPWPIIGNLLDIPKTHSWLTYIEMGEKYGSEIVFVSIFGQAIVVLNSIRVAKDLLEKHGEIYSDRPIVPFFEMMEWHGFMPISRYPDPWRPARKVLDQGLRPGAAAQYRPMQQAKTRLLLSRLLEHPDELERHFELLQGEVILSMTYGYNIEGSGDKFLAIARHMSEIGAATIIPGATLVNELPLLRHIPAWLPWFSYQPLARVGRELWEEIRLAPIQFAKQSVEAGTATHSLALENLQDIHMMNDTEREKVESHIGSALGSLYAAGADTTVSAMMTLILALTLHPDVQIKAQTEIDAIIGRERLPTFDDRPSLPYIDAICKEVLRWRPVTPLGVPHATTRSSVYEDRLIPKGAIVMSNIWAMLHDPTTYPDPDLFKPERFLREDGSLIDDPMIAVSFGFGKRICPGRHFADATLFIMAASLLSVFDVQRKRDAEGREIHFEVSYSGNLLKCVPPIFTFTKNPIAVLLANRNRFRALSTHETGRLKN
ncbi:cytochrome P450 [Gloeopeniophorella convolvens]|nr:cytochrome P450 [Gloeopeniophorella convolvens]